MSRLLDVLLKLNDTQDAIRRMEVLLSENPADKSMLTMLESLQKRASSLEDSFMEASDVMGLDVCAYRLFSEELDRYPIRSLGRALESFQKWFSTVYDALKNGPKIRAKIAPDVLAESTLDFAFSFTGSLGVALTIPSERQLFENDLQRAMVKTTEMLEAGAAEEIHRFADELGRATVQSFYTWLENHVESGSGADIRWLRGKIEVAAVRADASRLRGVANLIQETATPEEVTLTVRGLLVGADTKRHSFHMVFEEADEIRGTMSEAIGEEHTVELPREYEATVRRTSTENPATGQRISTYHLVRLRRI